MEKLPKLMEKLPKLMEKLPKYKGPRDTPLNPKVEGFSPGLLQASYLPGVHQNYSVPSVS